MHSLPVPQLRQSYITAQASPTSGSLPLALPSLLTPTPARSNRALTPPNPVFPTLLLALLNPILFLFLLFLPNASTTHINIEPVRTTSPTTSNMRRLYRKMYVHVVLHQFDISAMNGNGRGKGM
ncbi:hypothetical protein NX059_001738 [Plenodomus lindquistii]|nr:hypothetical protein NX059_001738 [Plenodomus lindquistii]